MVLERPVEIPDETSTLVFKCNLCKSSNIHFSGWADKRGTVNQQTPRLNTGEWQKPMELGRGAWMPMASQLPSFSTFEE